MRILFVGGGTLGSVTPLLAVAEELRARDPSVTCVWWGTRRGPERTFVEHAGIPFVAIPSGKLRRYWDIRNVCDPFVIAWAFCVSLSRLMALRPDVVVGAGSFAQVPVMWAAALLRIPIAIHQLDRIPGLANRFVAPFARSITAAFPGVAFRSRRAEVIGIPVRRAVLAARGIDLRVAKQQFGFSGDRPCVLVLGGGTGAQAVNELVVAALPELVEVADVIHITGKGKAHPSSLTPHPAYRVRDLLSDEMPAAYAAADFVIVRAGMGTIAELGALGKAAAFIPIPGTHQEANVRALVDAGAAVAWDQREIDAPRVAREIRALLAQSDRLQAMGERLGRILPDGAAARLADRVIGTAKQ